VLPQEPPKGPPAELPQRQGQEVPQEPPPVAGHYEAYASFAKVVRAWLVAYGIGAPVLFFSRDKVADAMTKSHLGQGIVIVFLVGVCIQVAGALLFKTTEWYLFCGEVDAPFLKCRRYKFAEWISNQYWIELLIDFGTIAAFIWATYKTLFVIAG
jgi:hypothetical protein